MATVEQCRHALDQLAERMQAHGPDRRTRGVDRALACTLTDPDVVFRGRLSGGSLIDVVEGGSAENADIRLAMTGDDLVELVDGGLSFAPAWARGRITIDAGMRDLLRLRSLL